MNEEKGQFWALIVSLKQGTQSIIVKYFLCQGLQEQALLSSSQIRTPSVSLPTRRQGHGRARKDAVRAYDVFAER